MDGVVGLLEPFSALSAGVKVGRPSFGVKTMLRIHSQNSGDAKQTVKPDAAIS